MSDHGASVERTRLAWRRTALSATAVMLLAVRPAVLPGMGVALVLLAAAAMIGWSAMIVLAYHRTRALHGGSPAPARRAMIWCAVITAALTAIGGLVVTI